MNKSSQELQNNNKTFVSGFHLLNKQKSHLDFSSHSQLFKKKNYLSYSACMDKHEDVGVGSSKSVQKWSSTRRQRGIGDMPGISKFS